MTSFDPRFSLAGLIVGVFVGLSGVGGSAILAPILILLLGIKPSVAIGTDLLYSVPTKLFALSLHARRNNVDWSIARRLLAGGVPGALVGLAAIVALRAHLSSAVLEPLLRHIIGIAILLGTAGGTFMLLRAGKAPVGVAAVQRTSALVAIGALVGFLVSLTSIGSGSVTLPLLLLTLPAVALRRLIGSEIAFAAFLVPLAAAGHASFGDVNWPIALALIAGSLPGVWIGTRLCSALGDAWLRPIVLGVLVFAGVRLI